jgi:hypothetical protein
MLAMSARQRGQLRFTASSASSARAAFAPHRGQCLLPKNIMPKHDGQETVASRALQNKHCAASLETAAPHIGQLRDSGFIFKAIQTGMDRMNRIRKRERVKRKKTVMPFHLFIIYPFSLLSFHPVYPLHRC